jgi:hypothetical protein
MANWKKIIVSGSNAELKSVSADSFLGVSSNQIISSSATQTKLSGSFNGTFVGDGSGLTNVVGTTTSTLSNGTGIAPFTFNGSQNLSVEVSGSAELTNDTIIKWDGVSKKFVNTHITDDDTNVVINTPGELNIIAPNGVSIDAGVNLLEITGGLNVSGQVIASGYTGSFTGSFVGDGSGLTGLVTTLSGSTDSGNFEVDLLTQNLSVVGTPNQIETSATGQSITVGLPDNVTITQNLTIGGDLVVQGSVTEIQTTNLLVEDRYILLNSGSIGNIAKGGIVIDSGNGSGKAFILGESSGRWGFTSSLAHNSTTATPDAFAAAVVTTDIIEYRQVGNIRVEDGEIYIWA